MKPIRLLRSFSIGIAGLAVFPVSAALAQATTSSSGTKDTQVANDKANPQGGSGLKVDLGYRYFDGSHTGTTYYNIVFQGTTLATQGQSFKDPSGYNDFTTIQNDSPSLQFSLERGVVSSSGPLANFLKSSKIPGVPGFRGIAQVFGQAETPSSLGVIAGIERAPLFVRIPGVPNFLALGVQAGSQPTSASNAAATGSSSSSQTGTHGRTDVGLFSYRQYIGYSPLIVHSIYRRKVLALAKDLVQSAPSKDATDPTDLNFFKAIRSGDKDALTNLAGKSDAVKKDIAALTDDEKTRLLTDLSNASTFVFGEFDPGVPDDVVKSLQSKLTAAGATGFQQALAAELDKQLSGPPAPPPAPAPPPLAWRSDKAQFLRAVSQFVRIGGLVHESNLPDSSGVAEVAIASATTDQKNIYIQRRKKYVTDTMKITDTTALKSVNDLIDLAYAQKTSDDLQFFLVAANQAIVMAILPEMEAFKVRGVIGSLFKPNDRPKYVFLIQNTGQYYFAGDDGNGVKSRLNQLFTASLTVYQHPEGDQRTYFRLRYDNGRDKAAPTAYLNQATATVGLEF